MMRIAEADWRRLRQLKPLALERLCNSILEELMLAAEAQGTSHERYLKIFQLIQERDKQIVRAFDGLSRANALLKLKEMRAAKLVTDQEFGEFSDETKGIVS